ncbi:hypothetical protein BKA66DRAFT_470387 [Pyrenochaeta sp. MPI-SDFR-AT-0127]|nr:hypothetical protein BKA66DRAFT_470387 [Pyrenochaeta sp. MPI-SDFR-AT-0127]
MANAYYFAAHFNSTTVQTEQNQQSHTPSKPTPRLSLIGARSKDTPLSHNVFMSAAQRWAIFSDGHVDEQEDSIFFRLPAELRNEVYKELLCSGTPNLKELAQYSDRDSKQEPVYPEILSTCRKIHEEATDLLYTTHIFHAHPSLLTSLPHLTSSAKPVLCPSVLSKINRWQLTIRLDTDPRFTMSQATAAFSGAEFLEIRVWQSMFDGCDSSVLRLFTGIRGVKVAKVGGSANPELARWLEKRMMQPIEEKDERDTCHCEDNGKEVQCGRCYKRVNLASEWFSGRDAWSFGNR